MLNFYRFVKLYWYFNQWDYNTVNSYKLHKFYRKLCFKTGTSLVKLYELKEKKNLSSKKPIDRIIIINKNLEIFTDLYNPTNSYITTLKDLRSCVNDRDFKIICNDYSILKKEKLRKVSVRWLFKIRKTEPKNHIWSTGYKRLSFFTKQTIMYEKNRKVSKAKLFIKFSKLYNFFKNVMNASVTNNNFNKKQIYMYYLKKKYKLSIGFIFKRLAEKLTAQKKKKLILNVPYRK